MEISEFRRTVPTITFTEEIVEAEKETHQAEAAAAVTVEADPDEDDTDDSNVVYQLDDDGLDDLEDVYDFLDDLIGGVLKGEVKMPIGMVKELELAIADVHTIVNTFRLFKPEDAGVPCIAATLEDEFRNDSPLHLPSGEPSGDLHLPQSAE